MTKENLEIKYKIYNTKNLYLADDVLDDNTVIAATANDNVGIAGISNVDLSYKFLLLKEKNIGNHVINEVSLNSSIRKNTINPDEEYDEPFPTFEMHFELNEDILDFLNKNEEFIVFAYCYETEHDDDWREISVKKLKYAFEFNNSKVYNYYINDLSCVDATITVLSFFKNLNYISFIDNKVNNKIVLFNKNN